VSFLFFGGISTTSIKAMFIVDCTQHGASRSSVEEFIQEKGSAMINL
jgi:hypothetical protein